MACDGSRGVKKHVVFQVTVKRIPSYNIDKAVAYLRAHVASKSLGDCAGYVKRAMAAGGAPNIVPLNGVDTWEMCAKHGFTRVNLLLKGRTVIGAQKGDIASMGCFHHHCGHAAMYDGTQWISDFKLGANCVPYRSGHNGISFWRWTDGLSTEPYFVDSPGGSDDNYTYSDAGGGGGTVGNSSGYYVDPNATTLSGEHNNLFNEAGNNAFTVASLKQDTNTPTSKDTTHTRIYSTNDATIILDELSMPVDNRQNDNTSKTNKK